MRHLIKQEGLEGKVSIDSAGLGDWHVGCARDTRSQAVGQRRGIPLDGVARQWKRDDFARFDYVLAMDHHNRLGLLKLAPDDAARAKVRMLRSFDPASSPDAEVPDPYYGGARGFEEVFDICDAACRGLLAHLRRTHALGD
jgi:protein-tyrosine phosphatase